MSIPARIGKYEVLDAIGRGGFATVYKARDPLMKRVVAIKLCSERDEDQRKRFLREAQIAGSLDHPGIVRGFECGFDEAGVYLVEEYLDGEDLTQKIRSRLPLPYRERLRILIEVAQAIAYAHSKGVVHRDLKPGNIRILESGRAKLMDFGIGKFSGSETPLTKAGTLLGTAGYVAPEQVLGKAVDHRVDIFAFGALAYEFLTYEKPFTGRTVTERLRSVLEIHPGPIAASWAECPSGLESTIARCLAKDPAARYQSFAPVIADLERAEVAMKDAEEAGTAVMLLEPPPTAEAALDAPGTGFEKTVIAMPIERPPLRAAEKTVMVTPVEPAPQRAAEKTVFVTPIERPPLRAAEKTVMVTPVEPPPRRAAEKTVFAPPIEPPPLAASPGRPPLDGARRLAGAVAAIVTGIPRRWLLVAIFALACFGAAMVVWSVFSREGAAEPQRAAVSAPAPLEQPQPAVEPEEVPSGRLVVNASPWGELVAVIGSDGESVEAPSGSSTPLVLTLPPGEYEVRVAGPGSDGEPRSCRVDVLASATAQCRIELGRVTGLEYFKESGWWQ